MPYEFVIDGKTYISPNPWMYQVVMTDPIWTMWTTSSSITPTTMNYNIIQHWYNTATTTSYNTQVWNNWEYQQQIQQVSRDWNYVRSRLPRVSEEERTRRDAERFAEQQNRWQEQAVAEQKRRQERVDAELRAHQTLLELLDEKQRKELVETGSFTVCSRSGKKYRIGTHTVAGNVALLDKKGHATRRYCCHLYGGEPKSDHHIAQMMALMHDEEMFLRLANVA